MPNGDSQNSALVFVLGLIATLGTVLGLGSIGGGADIVRRNALTQLRWGGGLVLAAVLLAGMAAVWRGALAAKVLLTIGVVLGVSGLAVTGWGVTRRSRGRPEISVMYTGGTTPILRITVKAGGLKANDDLNLYAAAFRNAVGNGLGARLVRASFGPDPSGDASVEAEVPVKPGSAYKSVVIRAWVGEPGKSGPCFFEKSYATTRKTSGKLPNPGCVIFPLALTRSGASGQQGSGPISGGGPVTTGPVSGRP
jgi:hypothetical protein